MPTTKEDLPGTIKRSPQKVQDTYAAALDGAYEQYDGDEERSHRTAYAAVKHIAEKVGDHWELKDEWGPSDPQSKQSTRAKRERPRKTFGGVDVEGNTKDELYERAKKLGVEGRSDMTKEQLAEAIARRQ